MTGLAPRRNRLGAKPSAKQTWSPTWAVIGNLDYWGLWSLFKPSWDFHQDNFHYEVSCAARRSRNLVTVVSPGALPFPLLGLD